MASPTDDNMMITNPLNRPPSPSTIMAKNSSYNTAPRFQTPSHICQEIQPHYSIKNFSNPIGDLNNYAQKHGFTLLYKDGSHGEHQRTL